MTTFPLESWLAERSAEVNALLDARLPQPNDDPGRLVEAMRYSLLAPGKRLRPILVMAAAECCGTPGRKVLKAAAALEMIHTYSLIHDDLPAMDNDTLRRGRPTLHVVYGDGIAVLAGENLAKCLHERRAILRLYVPPADRQSEKSQVGGRRLRPREQ